MTRTCVIYGCSHEIPIADCLCKDHATVLRSNRPLYDALYRSFNRYAASDEQSSGFISVSQRAGAWIAKALEGERERARPSWDALKLAVRGRDELRGLLRCELHDVTFAPGKACRQCGGAKRTTSTGVQLRLV